MGFFSWDCQGCGHPMLSEWSASPSNDWMRSVVVIEATGSILKGIYDGYGRVESRPIDYGTWVNGVLSHEPCCHHEACWLKAGSPTDYTPSKSSDDQGFFFDEHEHDMACPVPDFEDPKPPTEEDRMQALKAVLEISMGTPVEPEPLNYHHKAGQEDDDEQGK